MVSILSRPRCVYTAGDERATIGMSKKVVYTCNVTRTHREGSRDAYMPTWHTGSDNGFVPFWHKWTREQISLALEINKTDAGTPINPRPP